MNGGNILSLNITGTPSLTTFTIQNATYFIDLVLVDSGTDNVEGLPTGLTNALETVDTAVSIQTDRCVGFYRLRSLYELRLHAQAGCDYFLKTLTSIDNFTLTNAADISLGLSSLKINGSMILENSVLPSGVNDLAPVAGTGNTIDLSQVTSAGWDLNITSNSNVDIDFGQLESVDRNLAIQNNTNCTFNFRQLTKVGNLLTTDNPNTTLPIFSNLERADNIHLRGYIDTSDGPNIFPALTYVPGTVMIEAWNSDFNCSKLVAQWHDRIINNLTCNGTDNGGNTADGTGNIIDTSSSESRSSLSQGAWAGIGVAVGIVVLAAIATMTWLVVYFKRRLHKLEIAHPPQSPQAHPGEEPAPLYQSERAEIETAPIIREKPDDHVREIYVPPTVAEKPNDEVYEMATEPTELQA
ncbi:hypothetical protein F5Y05DRAFT_422320 [Hypoxylon sp. FL0543]|nr:hypothetical protein F5Y05DRAFT_422320 [Hypoxylon sp. FL0543]